MQLNCPIHTIFSLKYFTLIQRYAASACTQFYGRHQSKCCENKQTAFKHLVRRDRGRMREAPWGDVWFSSEICGVGGRMEGRAENETKKGEEEPWRQFTLRSGFRWRSGMHSQTTLNTLSHTQEDTKTMAFKCIATGPCDSHGVVSWEHPPPLISLMEYSNRKSAWPATPHHTTPTDNCSLFHTQKH